jgi:hypothetical protein
MTKFKKQNKIAAVFFFLMFGLVFFPSLALAQMYRIYFSPIVKEIYQDDIFILELRISSLDQKINAADVSLLFDKDKLEVKDLNTGGSLFTLWPQKPVFSNEEGKISFVGGTPNGFQGENALVLKIIFLAKNKGKAKIDFQDTTLFFLADGKGTPINPWLKSLTLNILGRPAELNPKNEWQSLKELDKIPPEPFEIKLSRDPSIFNNQYFITFFTTDKESGIDHYEIKEGTGPYVVGNAPYLLKDQKLKSIIRVKAVDKAGNSQIAEILPRKPLKWYENWEIWIMIIVAIVIIWLILLIFRKRRYLSRFSN